MAFNPLVLKREDMELIQKNNQLHYGPHSPDAPTEYQDIQDYERHFESVLSNIEQHMRAPSRSEYVNEHTPDVVSYEVKDIALLRLAAQDNPELMQRLDEMERNVLEKPEVQKRIEEQATSRGAFQIYNFLEELGQKHNIEYPIEEWKKESTIAYIQGVKSDIEASHGDYDKMTDTIMAVTNMMDAVDAKLIAEHVDLSEFWKECGYMSAQAQSNVPEQSLFVDVLQLECESPDFGEEITPSVEAGKDLYAYEHRHNNVEYTITVDDYRHETDFSHRAEILQTLEAQYTQERAKLENPLYMQALKNEIEAAQGDFAKMEQAVLSVSLIMERAAELDSDIYNNNKEYFDKFWENCGYLSAQINHDSRDQRMFAAIVQQESQNSEMSHCISPYVEMGEAKYEYEHRHDNPENIFRAADKIYSLFQDYGSHFTKEHFHPDIVQEISCELGTAIANLEIKELQQNTWKYRGEIEFLQHHPDWKSQYENIGQYVMAAREETIKNHADVCLQNGQVVAAPYNPLLLKDKEIQQIINEMDKEVNIPKNNATYQYAKAVRSVLEHLDSYAIPFQAKSTTEKLSPVETMAVLRHQYKDDPSMLNKFEAVTKQAYEDADIQKRVEQQAVSISGYNAQNIMRHFGEKYGFDIPVEDWKQSSDKAFIAELQQDFEQAGSNTAQLTQVANTAFNLLGDVDRTLIDENMDIHGLWETIGFEYEQAAMRLENQDYQNDICGNTPTADKNFIKTIDAITNSNLLGIDIQAHIDFGKEESRATVQEIEGTENVIGDERS